MLRNFRDTMIVVGAFSHRISSIRLRNTITVKFSTRPRLLQYQLYAIHRILFSLRDFQKQYNIILSKVFVDRGTYTHTLMNCRLINYTIGNNNNNNISTISSLYYFTLKHCDILCGVVCARLRRNVLLLRRF